MRKEKHVKSIQQKESTGNFQYLINVLSATNFMLLSLINILQHMQNYPYLCFISKLGDFCIVVFLIYVFRSDFEMSASTFLSLVR